IEEIRLDFPVFIKKIKRAATTARGFVIGGVTGVTEIVDTEQITTAKQKIVPSNSKTKTI
ncbi:MAG: hypothetical protein WBM13_05730, partial [Bacteroidia bacterium]